MTGKLKTKGNMMLATKLDSVLRVSSRFMPVPLRLSHIFLQNAKAKGGKAKL